MTIGQLADDDMTTDDIATALAVPIGDLGGRFMLSGRTYATGADLGFSGLDFYFCGRGGVLGSVDASVVIDELGFFEPANVRRQWESGLSVMAPDEAARHFLECGYEWGRARLPADLDGGRLAELTRAVVEARVDDQPALFRAWAEVLWPEGDTERALHAIHLLREMRGGQHVRAAHQFELDPHAAVVLQTGEANAELFGWSAPHPDPAPMATSWADAERATNDAMVLALSVLDAAQQRELLALAGAAVPS